MTRDEIVDDFTAQLEEAIERDVAHKRIVAENEEELQRQMAEVRKGNFWTCLYCGVVTRDRSTAEMHAAICEKWPYRLEAERLQAIFAHALAHSYGPYSDKELLRHVVAILKAATPKAAENTKGVLKQK